MTDRENTPRVTALASELSQTFRRIEEDAITGAIISEDELADQASPELSEIRRNIAPVQRARA
ncbi:MAG: hypothetical protein V8Q82_02885 [Christensenellales bacterium]